MIQTRNQLALSASPRISAFLTMKQSLLDLRAHLGAATRSFCFALGHIAHRQCKPNGAKSSLALAFLIAATDDVSAEDLCLVTKSVGHHDEDGDDGEDDEEDSEEEDDCYDPVQAERFEDGYRDGWDAEEEDGVDEVDYSDDKLMQALDVILYNTVAQVCSDPLATDRHGRHLHLKFSKWRIYSSTRAFLDDCPELSAKLIRMRRWRAFFVGCGPLRTVFADAVRSELNLNLSQAESYDYLRRSGMVIAHYGSHFRFFAEPTSAGWRLEKDPVPDLSHSALIQCEEPECGKTYTSVSGAKYHHAVAHSDARPHLCREPGCGATFKTTSQERYHYVAKHTSHCPFMCGTCGSAFKFKEVLLQHYRVHSNERPWPCHECKSSFKTRSELYIHSRRFARLGRKWKCKRRRSSKSCSTAQVPHLPLSCSSPGCERRFAIQSVLDDHIITAHTHERPYVCHHPGCRASFKLERCLNDHGNVIHGHTYPCEECEEVCPSQKQLNAHRRSAHFAQWASEACGRKSREARQSASVELQHLELRPFECDQCPGAFKDKWSLFQHGRVHSDKRPFSCDECRAAFKNKGSLSVHMRVHQEAHPYACSLCPASFKYRTCLNRHQRVHTGERPFLCRLCPLTFQYGHALKIHKAAHNNPKRQTCEKCGAVYANEPKLHCHQRDYDGLGLDWPCKDCGEIFPTSRERYTHRALAHLYVCNNCNKSFKSNDKLRSHLISHSDARPHECTFCPSRFKRINGLRNHVRREHLPA